MTWLHHGTPPAAPLLAGVLPRTGLHFLIGSKESGKSTIAADFAVALAAGAVGCGLSQPDKSGVRTSLAGFFGHPTGAPAGVAIITDMRHAGSISNAVHVAALARGITSPLPVSWISSNRLNARDGLIDVAGEVARHRDGLGLVIIDEIAFDGSADLIRGLSLSKTRPDAPCSS